MADITCQIKECGEAGLVYEYKKTDYPKHCSPCFLVAKPGSTAKRLVVHYKKVNQKIKLHSSSLPLMENTVETAAGCRYKTKMDKRSGFWQIDLTERAQDLTAFIAPDERVYKWRVMPFGIANAPALAQELMNQIIALCKRGPAVQELLQHGAVLEAHIDDVILGTNTIDDYLLLLREFYTVCQENHLHIKLEKCESLKTETDYLGFHIGDGWWKPQDQEMKPLMDFDLTDSMSKAEGVQKIRQFIGSCIFSRRHLRNFTEASAPLTDLIKKETPWPWGPIEKQAIEDVKKKIRECLVLGVPQRYGEMILNTDASNVGGGGTLLQWQKLTTDQCKDIDYRLRVQGVTREGFMKSDYDTQEWRLIPLGHWRWKWNAARSHYHTYEQELLAGDLVLASQHRILGTNPITWLCDQDSVKYFMERPPPDGKRLQRWWVYLSQLRLVTFDIRGIKNELCDYLSRNCFDSLVGADTEMMAQEAFAKMDQHLDLFTRKEKLMSWSMKDLTADYSDILDQLTIGSSKILDGVQWSRTLTHLYREDLICVPKDHEETMLEWTHKTDGHPGVERTIWFFQKYFFAKSSDTSLKKILSKIIAECPCTKTKANTAADRGEVSNLPIPNQMNSILYVDFMHLPKFAGHDFALLVTDGLSRYSRVFPLTKKVDGEGVLKEIFEGWVQVYGLPKIMHSDQDIRFTSPTGWYRSVMRAMRTEVQFGTPYLRTKHPLCERQIGCFKTVMRILMLNKKSRNWLKLVPYAIYLMNNQVSSRTGFTPTELFLGRPGFNFEFPCASEGNPKVDEWLTEQKRIADLCRSLLERKRNKENRTKNRKRKEAIYQIGDWVLVHHTRFKAWPRNTLDSPYFGPFLVTDVAEGSVWIKTHPKYGGLVEKGYPQLKHSDVLDDLYDWEEDLQESLEAAAEDLAADPMDEDEELPPMENDGSLQMPERDISLSRPTVPTPTAEEARPKRISASEPVTFTESEMKKQDYYFVERILRHTYKRGWRFYTKWSGYSISDCTWEPVTAFILDDGNVNEAFAEYCKSQDLRDIPQSAQDQARKRAGR